MGGNGTDTEAGRIDVVSCGVGFPKDAETLGLIGRADVVFGSRALLGACPVEARLTRIIGAKAREDAADALALCRAGRHVVVLASGDALYHGFGGTLSGMARPDDAIVHHPGITAFQALFHRLGLPWQDARLFSAHSGEALPARAIAEAPLSVAYAGSRYPAHAIAQAVLKLHPASAERAAVIAERLGSPKERLFSGPLADLARTECGPTSILLLLPNHWGCAPHSVARFALDARPGPREDAPAVRSIPAPILTLGLPEEDYERENNLITASDVRAVILSRLRLPAWGTLWDIGAGSGSVGLEAAGLRPNLNVIGIERKPERGAIIERNRARLGVPNYTLHIGDALGLIRASSIGSLPNGMPGLPRPSTPDAPYNETSVREAGNGEHPMPAYPCGKTPKAYSHRAESEPSSPCGIADRKEWTVTISPASSIDSLPSGTPGLPRTNTHDTPHNETPVREAGNGEHPMPAYPCGETPKAYNHRAESEPASACGIADRKEWTTAISPTSSIDSLPNGMSGLPRPNTSDAPRNETSVREAGDREHPMPAYPCGETPKAYSHRVESEPASACGIADKKEWTAAISPASSIDSLPSGTPGLPRPNTHDAPHNETSVREAGNREHPMPASPCGKTPKAYSHRAESEPSSPCGIADRKEWTVTISPASSIDSLPSGTPGLPRPNTHDATHNETSVREAGNREHPMPASPCGEMPKAYSHRTKSDPSSACGIAATAISPASPRGSVPPGGQSGNPFASPYNGTPAAQPPHQSKVLGKRGDGGPGEGERTTRLQKGFLSPSPGISAPSLLPPPDRVFIGGGGRGLPELLEACMERLAPGGIMVVSAVTLESFHTLYAWSPERRTGLCSLNIAHEQPIAGTNHHLKQQNTIYLFTFQKEIMP